MSETNTLTDQVLRSLLDEIATALVLADDADKESLLSVEQLLADLRSLAEKVNSSLWLGRAKEWSARLKAVQNSEGKPALRALDALTARVADIKSRPVMLLQPEPKTPAPSVKSADDAGGYERPLWIEQEVLAEFLSEQGELADDLEAEILALESEKPDLAALRRRIHTVKGEAGVLGMDDLAQVCHSLEDFLDSSQQLEGRIDLLLVVKDWIADALEAYTKGRLPKPSAAEVVKRLGIPLADTSSPSVPAKTKPQKKSEAQDTADKQQPKDEDALDSRALQLRQTLKVDLERVDHLVELIGELVIAESMVAHAPEVSSVESPRVHSYLSQLNRITRELQDAGMRMRMVPLRSLFQKMTRMARDAAHRSGKDVRLIAVGQGTEIDRSMVERIADPIMHLIRNAVSHGIETPEERLAAGKPAEGTILLSAQNEGGSIIIEVADDGRGLDHQKVLARAQELGLIDPEDTGRLSEHEVLNLVFHPGLSTADRITEVSGRGVGLDVVKKNISSIRGRATVTSDPGEGTTFSIILPLTLAIIDGMLVACGSERYVIPTLSVVESIQVKPEMLSNCAGRLELVNVRGKTMPLIRLAELLGVDGAITDPCQGLVVIVEGVGQRLALLVDEVINQQQVVIKSLGDGIEQTQLISGGAIMSDGRVGLILNVEDLTTIITKPDMSSKLGATQQSISRLPSPSAGVITTGDEMNQQKEEGA